MFRASIADAAWAPWFILALVSERVLLRFDIYLAAWTPPLAGLGLTLAVLALAARSRFASVLVVLWFLLNILAIFDFLAVYDGHD